MNKKVIKVTKIAITIFMIVIFIISLIVSQNEHHLEKCQEDHCIICTIIHIAKNIINLAISFVIAVLVGALIYFFLSRLHKEQTIFVQLSLVSQNVQMNE